MSIYFKNLSALEISRKIKNKEITVYEITSFCEKNFRQKNAKLNAIVDDHFSSALEKADRMDRHLLTLNEEQISNLPPFWGIPFTCKEMFSIEGLKSTWGSKHRSHLIMSETATVFERYENAGGNFVGTTNIPEVGFWFECSNPVYGTTINPFNEKRTSGGSTGGEAVSLSAQMSLIGIGSDLGGSIRIPASFCGVFGHKPTFATVPLTGHYPITKNRQQNQSLRTYPTTIPGPISRSASDLAELYSLMRGPDSFDPRVESSPFSRSINLFSGIEEHEIEFVFIENPKIHGCSPTEDFILNKVNDIRRYFESMGNAIRYLPNDTFLRSFDIWLTHADENKVDNFSNYLSQGNNISFTKEFLKAPWGKATYSAPALITAFLQKFNQELPDREFILTHTEELRSKVNSYLGKNKVLVYPIFPTDAPLLNSGIKRPLDFCMSGVFNALGFPATAIPMGLSPSGTPFGIQIISALGHDFLNFKVAKIFENVFGGVSENS